MNFLIEGYYCQDFHIKIKKILFSFFKGFLYFDRRGGYEGGLAGG